MKIQTAFHYIEMRALGPSPDLAPLVKACRADLAELPPGTADVLPAQIGPLTLDRLVACEADLKLAQAKIENLRAELEIERKGNQDLSLELERLPELQKELEKERTRVGELERRIDINRQGYEDSTADLRFTLARQSKESTSIVEALEAKIARLRQRQPAPAPLLKIPEGWASAPDGMPRRRTQPLKGHQC